MTRSIAKPFAGSHPEVIRQCKAAVYGRRMRKSLCSTSLGVPGLSLASSLDPWPVTFAGAVTRFTRLSARWSGDPRRVPP